MHAFCLASSRMTGFVKARAVHGALPCHDHVRPGMRVSRMPPPRFRMAPPPSGGGSVWSFLGGLVVGITAMLVTCQACGLDLMSKLGGGLPDAQEGSQGGGGPGEPSPSKQAPGAAQAPEDSGRGGAQGGPEEEEEEEEVDVGQVLALRKRHFSPNLSLSFSDAPLCITSAKGQYLFTHDGRRILDCVNNVAHVGHSHPKLSAVAARQLLLVNTNTRYLDPTRVRYASKLLSTFPEGSGLDMVFFVNSGSEANDLALRLARAYTRGAQDVIVLGAAYHGHTAALIEVSPYKYEGRGGFRQRPHVHKATAADTYRGAHTGEDAGPLYAQEVRSICEGLSAKGKRPAAFIAESILGCGGQLVLPDGYLEAVYDAVREAGGVCIADEVQVGFGRVGERFWAFETQGVVPDIVTLGKPMGNGFPLGAVVTRRAIAEAFANGMEYFNTFGGSNLSCAVGEAVLDIIQKEGLQENARIVGNYARELLATLQSRYPCVGEVRGLGLFLGVEMVEDPETREPSERIASFVARRAIDLGVQISTDGPFHNVLKIKPPLCFTQHDARTLHHAIDQALQEFYAKNNTGM